MSNILTNLFNKRNSSEEDYIVLVRVIQLITCAVTLMITLMIITSSNIKIFLFDRDISQNIVLIAFLFIVMLLLSMRPLMVATKGNLLVLAFGIFTCLCSIYIFYTIIIWYSNTLEGPISFRFIKLMMVASYETKAAAYIQAISNNVEILGRDNMELKVFMQNSTTLNTIVPQDIMHCKLQDITLYANTKTQIVLNEYQALVQKASLANNVSNGLNINYQNMLIGLGIVVFSALVIYYFKDSIAVSLGKLGLRGERLARDGYAYNQQIAQTGKVVSHDVEKIATGVNQLVDETKNIISDLHELRNDFSALKTAFTELQNNYLRDHEQIRRLLQINFNVFVPQLTSTMNSTAHCLTNLLAADKTYLGLYEIE